METFAVERVILPGGIVRLSSGACTFTYQRPRIGTLLVTIAGHDHGQFGTAPLDEILIAIQREGLIDLFVDARDASGASLTVSEAWTRFFTVNREKLRQVHILVSSEFIQLTVSIAQHLSRTGDLIKIHPAEESFRKAFDQARS